MQLQQQYSADIALANSTDHQHDTDVFGQVPNLCTLITAVLPRTGTIQMQGVLVSAFQDEYECVQVGTRVCASIHSVCLAGLKGIGGFTMLLYPMYASIKQSIVFSIWSLSSSLRRPLFVCIVG